MVRSVIRYVVLTAVVIGVVLVLGSLVNKEESSFKSNNKNSSNTVKYYTASVSVLDKESKKFIVGGEFILKTNDGKIIEEWENTENVKRISKLTNGTYVIEQKSAAEGYEVSDKTTFKIKNSANDIIIYNELVKDEKENKVTSNEINVDNTLSLKSNLAAIISIVIIGLGFSLLVNKKIRN